MTTRSLTRPEIEHQAPAVNLVRAESFDDAIQKIETASVVNTRELTPELLDHADSLDWIQTLTAVGALPLAGSTPYYWERSAEIFATNYTRYLDGEFESFVNRII